MSPTIAQLATAYAPSLFSTHGWLIGSFTTGNAAAGNALAIGGVAVTKL
jgi:hypothetical protein